MDVSSASYAFGNYCSLQLLSAGVNAADQVYPNKTAGYMSYSVVSTP